LGGGKRVRSSGPAIALARIEPACADLSSDIKKGSRVIIDSADARVRQKERKKIIENFIPDWPCPCDAVR